MNDFIPHHYRIELAPDLADFRFSGTVEIEGALAQPGDLVVLNAVELTIRHCAVQLDGDKVTCPFTVDSDKQELHVRLPRAFAGAFLLTIVYEGQINDRMAGFYRSRYRKNGLVHHIAVTQFEESDARRAFPCVDHPLKKATFDVEMLIASELTALSNSAIEAEEPAGDGRKRVRFRRTPKMSTYLLFFGVGDFESVTNARDPRVRVITTPGMTPYAAYGLAFGGQALQFCEDYYRIPYPLPKMDLVAVPDFAFGAMENWGAITFRENLLLHHPGTTSRSGEERICEVISHEIAHQWFGNLVTPSDWKYLWLNESFATFFGYGVVDHYHPDWGIWEQFIGSQTEGALVRDGLRETVAIEIPGGEHVVINTSTAPIIYSKGGSILRQIQGYIGKKRFRDGLTHYLKKHAYGNAASHDLWAAFETSAEEPVTRMMQSWIEQPGYPLITVERRDHQIVLRQKRFTYLPHTSDQLWDVPVTVRLMDADGSTKTVRTLMTAETAGIVIDADCVAYKVNADQTGFYRVRYANRRDRDDLGEMIRRKTLSPEDRWGLQNDLYALVRSGAAGIDEYIDFLAHYAAEDAYLPLSSITANLFQASILVEGESKARVTAVGRTLLQRALTDMGYEPRPKELFTASLLRDQVIMPAVVFGAEDVRWFAEERFKTLSEGGTVHPDILKSILQVGALTGGGAALEWMQQRFSASDSEHERLNILAAIGFIREKSLLEQALRFALADVPDRNKFIPIVSAAANPFACDHLWEWYTAHLKELEAFHPLLYERVIAAIVPTAGIERIETVKRFFERYVQERPATGDVVRLALEKLEINVHMRQRAAIL